LKGTAESDNLSLWEELSGQLPAYTFTRVHMLVPRFLQPAELAAGSDLGSITSPVMT
jgi:hypothetical protein